MSEAKSFFSAIQLQGPYVNSCELFVDPQGPTAQEVRCDVSIDMPRDHEVAVTDDVYALNHHMAIHVRLVEHLNGEEHDLMRIFLQMSGTVSLPKSVSGDLPAIQDNLLLNGVSLFYSSARSYIEFITGQSSMRRFTIPAIDPRAYLNAQSAE